MINNDSKELSMPYKPMKLRDYLRWIRQYGWDLEKGSVDWKLIDEQGHVRKANIIITHPGREVIARHVNDTRQKLEEEGLGS
jgi:hypothetical protein